MSITDEQRERLIALASMARKRSYCPYSKKSVGAALLARSGEIYKGCNIENASYPAGICAERSALAFAVSFGERAFDAIAIEGGDEGKEPTLPFFPCGICRQALAEFCGKDLKIFVTGGDGTREYTLGELLPEAFSMKGTDGE